MSISFLKNRIVEARTLGSAKYIFLNRGSISNNLNWFTVYEYLEAGTDATLLLAIVAKKDQFASTCICFENL